MKKSKEELIKYILIESNKIKEEDSNTYIINMGNLIIAPFTKIYIGYASEKVEVIKIQKISDDTSCENIDSVNMIHLGVCILNKYVFNNNNRLKIILDKKLKNKSIAIYNCYEEK